MAIAHAPDLKLREFTYITPLNLDEIIPLAAKNHKIPEIGPDRDNLWPCPKTANRNLVIHGEAKSAHIPA